MPDDFWPAGDYMTDGQPRGGCSYDIPSSKYRSGRLFSPRYPQNYPPRSRCFYKFAGERDERIKFTLHQNDLNNVAMKFVTVLRFLALFVIRE